MPRNLLYCSALALAVLIGGARASAQNNNLLPPVPTQPAPSKDEPKQKDTTQRLAEPAESDVFSRALVPKGDAPAGYSPHMLGDNQVRWVRVVISFTGTSTTTVQPTGNREVPADPITTTTTVTGTRTVLVPIPGLGPFKVGESASPRPQNRVFALYNFFSNIRGPVGALNDPLTSVTSSLNPGETITTSTTIPGAPLVNLHRETFGFEKTFLDGNASIEMRLPLLQQTDGGVNGFGANQIGDLTIITKYAFINDLLTGNVFSGGLAVTAPTGPRVATIDGIIRSTLLQPWMGYIYNRERLFFQAFHSIVVPTDARDVTLLFNDVGVNWWLYRSEDPDRFLTFVVPTFEAHITTPLNHRGANASSPIVVSDVVVLTGGVHLGIFRNSTFSFGVGLPVTGPRPYDVEAYAQFNMRY